MRRKLYILTFHRALNYGAALQCAALYRFIEPFADCEVIDYRSKAIESNYRIFKRGRPLRAVLYRIISYPMTAVKRGKFRRFMKRNVRLSAKYQTGAELREANWLKDAVFCVGSDQVWNTDLTAYDDAYTLDFVPGGNKRISYAASLGQNLTGAAKDYFAERLQGFDALSVREDTARRELAEIGISCGQNIDPIFLLSVDEWERISVPVQAEREKYILVYMLQKSARFMDQVVEYAARKNLPIVIISAEVKRRYPARYISRCSPEEFIRFFLKADTVFTDSFHGIAFSILFNKYFYYTLQGCGVKMNSRLADIIAFFGLERQNAAQYDSIPDSQRIDFEAVNRKIERERDRTKEYLLESVSKGRNCSSE